MIKKIGEMTNKIETLITQAPKIGVFVRQNKRENLLLSLLHKYMCQQISYFLFIMDWSSYFHEVSHESEYIYSPLKGREVSLLISHRYN